MKKIFLYLIILYPLFAGTTGKIVGRIVDSMSKEPLVGCNVYLHATSFGTATDIDGSFLILNIPPGNYDLFVSMIGYDLYKVLDLEVNIDLTSTINASLNESSLELESIIVNSSPKLVNKNLTSTTAIITNKTISKLPINEVSEILNLQAGFVDGHLRGGRTSEVAYWVDGVPMTDSYDGSTVIDINKDVIREMQLISGAFNAEYGQAMSGIVNITTKEGSNNFGGSFDTYYGDYVSSHSDIFRNIDDIDLSTTKNVNLNFHGSIIKNKLFYYLSSRYIYYQGVHEGYRIYNPYSYGTLMENSSGENYWHVFGSNPSVDETYVTSYCDGPANCSDDLEESLKNQLKNSHSSQNPIGDKKFVPMDWNIKKYAQINLIWKPTQTSKIKFSHFTDDVDFQEYDRYYQLNPDGNLSKYRLGQTNLLQINHTLNQNSYFTIGLIRYEKKYSHRTFDNLSSQVHEDLNYQGAPTYSFSTGGSNQHVFERQTISETAKFDYTNQINKNHQLKFGIEYKQHSIFYENINLQYDVEGGFNPIYDNPFVQSYVADISYPTTSRYTFHPIEGSLYLQDKIEFDDMIVNVGLRYDYFDSKGFVLAYPEDPFIYYPLQIEYQEQTLEERLKHWYLPAKSKSMISPRLGASFPISDQGVFHFSYGHFFQMPKFELLYHNADIDLDRNGTGNIGVIGNSDLKPEKTISYEIGIQYNIDKMSAIDMTMYFRDIRDLTGTRSDVIYTANQLQTYNKYQNSDFAFVKGLVFSYKKNYTNGFSTTFDYTLQQAKGTASDPYDAHNAENSGTLPEVHLIALDWDQRHTINITLYYDLKFWGAGIIGKFGTGQPYTPKSNDDFSILLENSKLKPTTWNIDLRTYCYIPGIKGAKIYMNVFNLFDHLNHINVYNDSGVADKTQEETQALNQGTSQVINSISKWYDNETYYSSPRRIEIGFRFEF